MAIIAQNWTLSDLETTGGPPGQWEIIEGALIAMSPAGGKHGRIGGTIFARLWHANHATGHGVVYGPDTGVVLRADPLLLRVPDVAFVSKPRLPANFDDGGYLHVAPDLVVEVVSPSDRSLDVLTKVAMWLEFGTRVVWVVEPAGETVTVYAADAAPMTLTRDDILTAATVLPHFSIPVADIFAL